MTKNVIEKSNDFLSQIHIKVTLQSLQDETAQNNAIAVISMIFSMIGFTCRPKYFLSKLFTVVSYFQNSTGSGFD